MKNLFLILFVFTAKIVFAQNVIFRTTVDKLRLREAPNTESRVIKTVEKETALIWLDVRSEQKMTADWKGGKATDYWYKINFCFDKKDSTAWVFGKGIEFLGMQFGTYETQIIPKSFENQWIKFEKSDSASFGKINEIKVFWEEAVNSTVVDKSKFTLFYDNGKS